MSTTATRELIESRRVDLRPDRADRRHLRYSIFPFDPFAQMYATEQIIIPYGEIVPFVASSGAAIQPDVYEQIIIETTGSEGIGLIGITDKVQPRDDHWGSELGRIRHVIYLDESFTSAAILPGSYDLAIERDDSSPTGSRSPERLPKSVLDRLNTLAQLPQNWDSYGAPPISDSAIQEAKSVLLKACTPRGFELPLPFVSPTGEGGIGMEWKLESGKELLLEVSSNAEVSYLLVTPLPDGGEEEIDRDIQSNEDLDELFRTL